MKILLITEQREATWNKVSFETLAAAQQIVQQTKGTLTGVVIGKGISALANDLSAYQLDEVLAVEHDLLEKYTPDGFALALRQVIESTKPDLVLFPHTYQVRDFAPKLAASLDKGMIGDCIALPLRKRQTHFRPANVSRPHLRGRGLHRRSSLDRFLPSQRFPRRPRHQTFQRHSARKIRQRGSEARADPHQAARPVPRSQASRGPHPGPDPRFRRPRHQSSGKYSPRRKTREADGRRNLRLAPHLRRRLAPHGPPDRQLRPDRRAQTLSRARASAAPSSTWSG